MRMYIGAFLSDRYLPRPGIVINKVVAVISISLVNLNCYPDFLFTYYYYHIGEL